MRGGIADKHTRNSWSTEGSCSRFSNFDVGQLIFRDCKAGMVPSTLGMCRYISRSEIVCRGPKEFENP